MFTKNLGAEISGSYLIGNKFDMESTMDDEVSKTSSINDESMKASMIRVIPAIKFMLGEKKFHPYVKAGLVVGMGGKIIEDNIHTSTMNNINYVTEEAYEFKGGISFGFNGVLGINYMFTNKIGVFAEASGICQNWAPKKSIMTKNINNGVDDLAQTTTYDKETDFVNSYSYSAGAPDTSQPTKSLKYYFPFSSIGINIGLHISFGKKEEKEETKEAIEELKK